jgi:hypothetical protein
VAQHEGIYDTVRGFVEKSGHDWNEELDNFYVAEGLHAALVKAKPNLFTSTSSCVDTLNNLYPYVQDVSSVDMIKAIETGADPGRQISRSPWWSR